MPLGYHINPDDGLITVQGGGEVPLSELARLGESLLEDPSYDPELPQILDFRGLRPAELDDDVDPEKLAALKAFLHETYRQQALGNVAVVIDEHLEDQHCADIFLLTCALQDAELFADYDQALKWLIREAFVPTGAAAADSAKEQDAAADGADGGPE